MLLRLQRRVGPSCDIFAGADDLEVFFSVYCTQTQAAEGFRFLSGFFVLHGSLLVVLGNEISKLSKTLTNSLLAPTGISVQIKQDLNTIEQRMGKVQAKTPLVWRLVPDFQTTGRVLWCTSRHRRSCCPKANVCRVAFATYSHLEVLSPEGLSEKTARVLGGLCDSIKCCRSSRMSP